MQLRTIAYYASWAGGVAVFAVIYILTRNWESSRSGQWRRRLLFGLLAFLFPVSLSLPFPTPIGSPLYFLALFMAVLGGAAFGSGWTLRPNFSRRDSG